MYPIFTGVRTERMEELTLFILTVVRQYSGGCAVANRHVGAVCAYLADHAGDLIEHDPMHLDLSQHSYEEDYFQVRRGIWGEINCIILYILNNTGGICFEENHIWCWKVWKAIIRLFSEFEDKN